MFDLTTQELEAFIADDLPYFDLTTYLQGVENQEVKLTIFTREDIVVSCIEEAYKIAQIFHCRIDGKKLKSGDRCQKGENIITLIGEYNDIHKAWRNVQIILEYSSKMATYTHKMKQAIEKVNPTCEFLATRKSFPFAKRFCIKSIMVGGAMPHRLGLSETVLLFDHHRKIYTSIEAFYDALAKFKHKAPEKKVVVESNEFEDTVKLMQRGADVIQLDKVDFDTIEKIIHYRNENYPHIKILVAGGINVDNVQEYATLGMDGIVTSSLYNAGMANLGSRMEIL
ncbi:MAG: ModD protein [Campylobacterales bacterium]|nr:ModD protein [Campylobacterales bacterium]